MNSINFQDELVESSTTSGLEATLVQEHGETHRFVELIEGNYRKQVL